MEPICEELGGSPLLTKFYAYEEISPLIPGQACALHHNQIMIVTTSTEE